MSVAVSSPVSAVSYTHLDVYKRQAWSRSEQQRLALDELETAAEIARLAGTPREVLGEERDRGGARTHRSIGAKGERGSVSEDETRQARRRARGAARRRLVSAERDVTEAAEVSEAARCV